MNSPDPKARLFRKVALDRLSSPEQLDTMVQVVTLRSWIALAPLVALVLLALVWSIFGSIPTKVSGRAILFQTGGLRDVTAGSAGRITEMKVKIGDTIALGQQVAVLAQPNLDDQIRSAQDRLAELQRQQTELRGQIARAQGLSQSLVVQQRAALERQIVAAQERARVMRERIATQQTLLDQGLITRQTLLNSQNELAAAQQEVENARSSLQQANLRRAEDEKRAMQELTAVGNQISETRRALSSLQASLTQTSQVVSSHAGRVVELKVGPGTLVVPGNGLVTVESEGGGNELEAVIYIPAAEGKRVEQSMQVQIAPSTVKREEYGYMIGSVRFVSDYAASSESMQAVLQNRQIVQELAGATSPIEVRASLRSGDNISGYRWSSEAGPPFKVRAGTLGTAEIVVYRQAPITLVIPLLKKSLGLD